MSPQGEGFWSGWIASLQGQCKVSLDGKKIEGGELRHVKIFLVGNGLPIRVCGNAGSNQSSVWEMGPGEDTLGGF